MIQQHNGRPVALVTPACPVCQTPAGETLIPAQPWRMVAHQRLRGYDEVIACFKCQPCTAIWCACKPLRRAA